MLSFDIIIIMRPELLPSAAYRLKLCEAQKRKPVYIPPLPSDYEDLVRLVYSGRDTDTE